MTLIRSMLFLAVLARFSAAEPISFTVESPIDGKVLKAEELRGKFVAVHFLLKTECPFCLKHTHDYARKAATLPGVEHVFLKPDRPEEIKAWAAKVAAAPNFPRVTVYRDPDAQLAEKLKIPNGYSFHGETVHYPALALFDPKGEEVFRYVGKSNSDRFSFERLAAKVSELGAPPAAKLDQYNLGPEKLALQGHDPVAYLTRNAATKGNAALRSSHRGVTYQFSSAENQKAFVEHPEKYLPTYGGWCATAMAKGEKVEVDPANFKVSNGRLFLFFKAFYANALKDWNKDEANLMAKADAHWKRMAGE